MDFTSPYIGGGAAPSFQSEGLASVIAGRERNTSEQIIAGGRNMATLAAMLTEYSDKQKAIKQQGGAAKTFLKTMPDDQLTKMGHVVEWLPPYSVYAGHAGIIRVEENGMMQIAADPRSDGAALGV